MSRSNPTIGNNPATKYFEWNAKGGLLQYYDKTEQIDVSVEMPFAFMVLDEVSMVGGGTKVHGRYEGYWSNSVKNLDTQIITVKSKQGVVAQGLYADLKNRKGLNYVKGLYIAFYDEARTLQIGFLKFKGSSLGAWFDFIKQHKNLYKGAFAIKSASEPHEGEQGEYYTPTFSHKAEIAPETETQAIVLDKQLQTYLKTYFAHKGVTEPESELNTENETEPESEPVTLQAAALSATAANDTAKRNSPKPMQDRTGAEDDSIPF